jgi:DNA mismatch endonuclease (patch repair protein)
MRANRGKDTSLELALRASLHRNGLRFYKDRRLVLQPDRRVRPDIVFPKLRLAVFVDGCFWHGCRVHRSIPASNSEFWTAKIEATRRRDISQTEWLEAAGWTVLRIWEHESTEDGLDKVVSTVSMLKQRAVAA